MQLQLQFSRKSANKMAICSCSCNCSFLISWQILQHTWSSLNIFFEYARGPFWIFVLRSQKRIFCNTWKKQHFFAWTRIFLLKFKQKSWNLISTKDDPFNHAWHVASKIIRIYAIFIELFHFEIGWSLFVNFENI